ncbi:hypothetical protein FRC06_003860 [Ceratobasidium sp. 370]|nr:hypothetical protein FRC06_003860 [Ceratobasidium sp. 370]
MLQNGHDVYISVRANPGDNDSTKLFEWAYADIGCHLHYRLDASSSSLDTGGFELAHITEFDGDFGSDQVPLVKRLCPEAATVMSLPYGDLQDSEWLSVLTLQEWQAWNTPRIDLARAHYFGDPVNIVINLEQTADLETRHIAETFSMNLNGGHVAVRHRIVYAGLMAAVVESWHPRGNHTYGVLLEDDVELSPMFYAWAKLCILRYRLSNRFCVKISCVNAKATPRYDGRNNQSSQLYGISLYQPKVTELRTEGRRPFDPKGMFTKLQLEYPHTPYLSQVPCSWGAVYFPEHWREFQRYLALRLSEDFMPVSDLVVPDLRSNKWSRSWKKFFNEMVFLRGYVSLYPNYHHFVSLSTNHLEMGEHVPANINQEKQRQYFLPLMQDAAVTKLNPGSVHGVKLLDLPLSNLPEWSALPILDLWGDVSSLAKLRSVGLARRTNLVAACNIGSHEDALQFFCPSTRSARSFEELHKPLSSVLVDDDGPDLMQG